jgi:hypothetical protein
MVKFAYLISMLYLLVISVGQLRLNPWYARSRGSSRWSNRIPNYVILLFCNLALLIYPFTSFPSLYARECTLQIEDQYLLGILSILMFQILAIGITFRKRVSGLGIPRSFIAHYLRLFFTRTTDPRDGADILLGQEYAVIGTFGTFIGPLIIPQSFITESNFLVVFVSSGLVSSLIYLVIAKLNNARYY